MVIAKRRVEVFTAGCPICDETVNLVKSLICPSCTLQIYDLRQGCATNECREKATRYGVTAVPAIAVQRHAVGLLPARANYCRTFESSRNRSGVSSAAHVPEGKRGASR